jgi:hypothetical protein
VNRKATAFVPSRLVTSLSRSASRGDGCQVVPADTVPPSSTESTPSTLGTITWTRSWPRDEPTFFAKKRRCQSADAKHTVALEAELPLGQEQGVAVVCVTHEERLVTRGDARTAAQVPPVLPPSKSPLKSSAAVEELRSCSGTQFDPQVVDALITALRR